MNQIKLTLIQRLEKKGLDSNLIPSFIRSLANCYVVNPHLSLSQVNRKLQYLGWEGVEMDYHTLQLVLSCFEDEGLKRLETKPVQWFVKRFDPQNLSFDDQAESTVEATL